LVGNQAEAHQITEARELGPLSLARAQDHRLGYEDDLLFRDETGMPALGRDEEFSVVVVVVWHVAQPCHLDVGAGWAKDAWPAPPPHYEHAAADSTNQ
jgi:hypothetical protein